MAKDLDRKLVWAAVQTTVGEGLGASWSRLKEIVGKAQLSEEEKGEAGILLIDDVRTACNRWCDEQRRRIVEKIGTPRSSETQG